MLEYLIGLGLIPWYLPPSTARWAVFTYCLQLPNVIRLRQAAASLLLSSLYPAIAAEAHVMLLRLPPLRQHALLVASAENRNPDSAVSSSMVIL